MRAAASAATRSSAGSTSEAAALAAGALLEGVDLTSSSISPADRDEDRTHETAIVRLKSQLFAAQPYLWRFWRNIPGHGQVTIFDRSWYGRVLVERVEGFCSEDDWMRAYGEINDFEDQLVRNDTILVKFWLHISKDEQLVRFREREKTGFKRFKITEEDWRNRNKWDAYERAVCNMVDRTSTEIAPWTLVEANDKSFARVKVLKTLCERIGKAL
jgi:AMP-polyphosphate phosphotransferase